MKKEQAPFCGFTLSGFCMQISLLYQSAVPLYDGLAVMAEDAAASEEKQLLTDMSDKLRQGCSFSETVREAGCFPSYMEEMILLGEQTGTLDVALKELSLHYEKEARLTESLRRALTYPTMMVSMLVVILFVLFTKIMPIFADVYEQLGAQIPPAAQAAIRIGGFASGLALAVILLLIVAFVLVKRFGNNGKQPAFAETILNKINEKSSIRKMTALRRTCSTMAVTLRCGLRTEEGLSMAEKMADHPQVEAQLQKTRELILNGNSFYDAVRSSELFTGFDLQLIRAASRAGQLESILDKLADDYDEKTADKLDFLIARMEPAIVTILAVAVGLVLLSVMLPLAGILSTIG